MESDKNTQEAEPTPQALSDGILVVGISSKGPRDLAGVENRIRYGKESPDTMCPSISQLAGWNKFGWEPEAYGARGAMS